MKKLLLVFLLILSPLLLLAEINECKTDVYWANGILTKQRTAIDNAGILEKAIIDKYDTTYYTKKIGEVFYAYNQTSENLLIDGKETLWQKFESFKSLGGITWQEIEDFLFDTSHEKNLHTCNACCRL